MMIMSKTQALLKVITHLNKLRMLKIEAEFGPWIKESSPKESLMLN